MLNTYTLTDSEKIDLIDKLSLLIKYIREDNSIDNNSKKLLIETSKALRNKI